MGVRATIYRDLFITCVIMYYTELRAISWALFDCPSTLEAVIGFLLPSQNF